MFVELLKTQSEKKMVTEQSFNDKIELLDEKESPEQILRNSGIKIRLVTATSFGVQIDFAKQYDQEVIENLLKDFNVKFKNKSIFIVN